MFSRRQAEGDVRKYSKKNRRERKHERKKEKKTGETERRKKNETMRENGGSSTQKKRCERQKQKESLEAEPVNESSEWISYQVNCSGAPSQRMPSRLGIKALPILLQVDINALVMDLSVKAPGVMC